MNRRGTEINYQGTELQLFAEAINWKGYWSRKLAPYAAGTVIEVGAGIGSSTKHLCKQPHVRRWLCLEPDPNYARQLASMLQTGLLPPYCEINCCILSDLAPNVLANTIFYIDVMEHIENDADEVQLAAAHLCQGGRLVVLSPAFEWLYSAFDKAIGHQRRYSRRDAKRLTPPGLELERVFFLDSVGMLASMANRLILRSDAPSSRQIIFWDHTMVKVSMYLDYVLGGIAGRSIIMIWKKR